MMVIDNKFELGQIVYCKTDTSQSPMQVTCIEVDMNGIIYRTSIMDKTGAYYAFELTQEPDLLLKTT